MTNLSMSDKRDELTGEIKGCMAFSYRGYDVSYSTRCKVPEVMVFKGDDASGVFVSDEVSEAIEWINKQAVA